MIYVEPTLAQFRARYPEFNAVSDELVSLVLQESIIAVDETWLAGDRAKAMMLLTAHTLTMEGEPARSEGGGGQSTVITQGFIKRDKVGDAETEFFGISGGSSGGGGGIPAEYASTVYGRRFWMLVRQNFAGPRVVGAGCPWLPRFP